MVLGHLKILESFIVGALLSAKFSEFFAKKFCKDKIYLFIRTIDSFLF